MKVLFLAPQPFYQERGTPIAVKLALEVLATRSDLEIDLLTYKEGQDIEIGKVQLHRIYSPGWLAQIRPGISFKKLLCDIIFTFKSLKLAYSKNYDLVHAVEEAVFIARLIKLLRGVPYIYDMDSSLALQLTEGWRWLRPLQPILEWLERFAVRGSVAVAPVCDALAEVANSHGSPHTQLLRDISLLDLATPGQREQLPAGSLRQELSLAADDLILLYSGNLEHYQGIDLLLEGAALTFAQHPKAQLIIVGGTPQHIQHYSQRVQELGLEGRVHLIGPRPVTELSHYLEQADILVSPRTKGNNTPMKIYSYLHSGKAILATNLPTHTQVLNSSVALLVEPKPAKFAEGLNQLLSDPAMCLQLGQNAFLMAEENYTFDVFQRSLNMLYDKILGGSSA